MRSSPERVIDLNADVGGGAGDEPLYAIVTSVNVACGGHAGDDASMRAAIVAALSHGVAAGAHPSYPDRARLGRASVLMARYALAETVRSQVAALDRVARATGARLAHVKPHGALYNDAARDVRVAEAFAEGVAAVSRDLTLVGLAGSAALDVWRAAGWGVAAEGFADRGYAGDGTLVPRDRPGALLVDPEAAARQAVALAHAGACATICVHGDTPGAPAIARAVRSALEAEGWSLRAPAPPDRRG
jgi:UPF0271 protein